jgi:hypothetical protein
MSILDGIPAWYFVVAIAFSCYYAYRGYRGNWIAFAQRNEVIPEGKRKFLKWEIISIYCVHDMLFHFICSLAGFFTLLVAYNVYEQFVSDQDCEAGRSVLLVFSFLFGVIGVTGQLPPLIQLGKLPNLKQ